MLTRDQILAATDLPTAQVDVPEWGGSVLVRTMTAGQRDRFEASVQGKRIEDIRATLAALTICGEDGSLLFSAEDVAALAGKSALALNRVFETAGRLNGILPGDVEELEKNYEGAR
jgi:hypothetical protein